MFSSCMHFQLNKLSGSIITKSANEGFLASVNIIVTSKIFFVVEHFVANWTAVFHAAAVQAPRLLQLIKRDNCAR